MLAGGGEGEGEGEAGDGVVGGEEETEDGSRGEVEAGGEIDAWFGDGVATGEAVEVPDGETGEEATDGLVVSTTTVAGSVEAESASERSTDGIECESSPRMFEREEAEELKSVDDAKGSAEAETEKGGVEVGELEVEVEGGEEVELFSIPCCCCCCCC